MNYYILQNSDGCYLNKDLLWCSNPGPNEMFKTEHRDIALNQLIELNARDISLRATIVSVDNEGLSQLFAVPNDSHAA